MAILKQRNGLQDAVLALIRERRQRAEREAQEAKKVALREFPGWRVLRFDEIMERGDIALLPNYEVLEHGMIVKGYAGMLVSELGEYTVYRRITGAEGTTYIPHLTAAPLPLP